MKHTTIVLAVFVAATLPSLAYEPIISLPQDHTIIHPAGGQIEVLATREQTDGQFSMLLLDGKAGEGPGPAIVYHLGTQTWYVVEGQYEFHVGDKVFDGGPGTFISVDAGRSHGFINKTAGKLLVMFQPGGYEHFFMDWEKANVPPGPESAKLEESYGMTRPTP